MLEKQLCDLVKGKKVLILGFGREGKSTLRMLKQISGYSFISIADRNELPDVSNEADKILSGENYLECIDDYDVVFKSPGVVLPRHRSEYKAYITSQIEQFLKCFCRRTIGITGTKGKSTTTSLLYHVLSSSGMKCTLAGNIGIPVFDIDEEAENDGDTKIVLELSCHQLEYCDYSPSTALFLNVYEDHLDHYGSVELYRKAKTNIYTHQSENDILYCLPEFVPEEGTFKSRLRLVDVKELPFKNFEELKGAKLRGEHNLTDCAFVYAVASSLGIGDDEFADAVVTFSPLPHRLEMIGKKNGAEYYDDSISTTAESTMNAIKSIKNAKTIILGGMDRGIHYKELIDFLLDCGIKNIAFMYESGKRMYDLLLKENSISNHHLKAGVNVRLFDNLKDAVSWAVANTFDGEACILSPASASYGDFKNFEERGDMYRRMIFENE